MLRSTFNKRIKIELHLIRKATSYCEYLRESGERKFTVSCSYIIVSELLCKKIVYLLAQKFFLNKFYIRILSCLPLVFYDIL